MSEPKYWSGELWPHIYCRRGRINLRCLNMIPLSQTVLLSFSPIYPLPRLYRIAPSKRFGKFKRQSDELSVPRSKQSYNFILSILVGLFVVVFCCCYFVFVYSVATSTVTSGWAMTCDSAHSWPLYSAVPLGHQATNTMNWYPIQSQYPDAEPTNLGISW